MTTRSGGRREGELADWNDDRGFGFLTPTGGGPRVFVHISAFPQGTRPRTGTKVTYAESRDERGRPRAVAVEYVGRTPRQRRPGLLPAVVIAVGFLLAVVVLGLLDRVPGWVPLAYLLLSVATLVTYRADKAAAQAGHRRTPETTLHLLALAGGWPGALVARPLFRHKTSKQPFVAVFWLTVVVNWLALLWLAVGGFAAIA